MKHLTDQQLIAELYGEAPHSPVEIEQHLKQCPECRVRLQQLSLTKQSLDQFKVDERNEASTTRAILERVRPQADTVARSTSMVDVANPRSRFGLFSIAASTLLMVGGLSFLIGMLYQSQQTTAAIQQQVKKTLVELQNSERDTERQEKQELVQSIQDQLTQLQRSLSEQDARNSAKNLLALQNIESQFDAFLTEQGALRRDLQTLAINAEGEITSAQRDIRQIGEYISTFIPSLNEN